VINNISFSLKSSVDNIFSSIFLVQVAPKIIKKQPLQKMKQKLLRKKNQSKIVLQDEHSLSNYLDVRTKHVHLDIEVNFESKTIYGSATHTIENINNVDTFILDTKYLVIDSVNIE
jgi:aminopeptidase N